MVEWLIFLTCDAEVVGSISSLGSSAQVGEVVGAKVGEAVGSTSPLGSKLQIGESVGEAPDYLVHEGRLKLNDTRFNGEARSAVEIQPVIRGEVIEGACSEEVAVRGVREGVS